MRVGIGSVHRGVGDFVPGKYTLPQNPVVFQRSGMGDFTRAAFSVPQVPVGMSGLGCGGGCNCGPCRGGMGAVDLSLTGTGIASSIGLTSVAIPNWAIYGAGAVVVYMLMSGGKGRRR